MMVMKIGGFPQNLRVGPQELEYGCCGPQRNSESSYALELSENSWSVKDRFDTF